jgi:hypothetical protein
MNHRFLLTGAGFSKNFGGMLASEMWTLINNDAGVRRHPTLRDRLLADQDFESVYYNVIAGGDPKEAAAMTNAVAGAYRHLDAILADFHPATDSANPIDIYGVLRMIANFAGAWHDPGFVFTLNQDLFLERHYYQDPRPALPGVRQPTTWFSAPFSASQEVSASVKLATPQELAEIRTSFRKHQQLLYIKLHGSCNWSSDNGIDQMIIGRDKDRYIARHPLLNWYLDLFKECLAAPRARLLVIGYGFADPHINRVMAQSVTRSGLEIHIVDPTPTKQLVDRIRAAPHGGEILKEARFHPYPLRELFPPSQQRTRLWDRIQNDFFGAAVGE